MPLMWHFHFLKLILWFYVFCRACFNWMISHQLQRQMKDKTEGFSVFLGVRIARQCLERLDPKDSQSTRSGVYREGAGGLLRNLEAGISPNPWVPSWFGLKWIFFVLTHSSSQTKRVAPKSPLSLCGCPELSPYGLSTCRFGGRRDAVGPFSMLCWSQS